MCVYKNKNKKTGTFNRNTFQNFEEDVNAMNAEDVKRKKNNCHHTCEYYRFRPNHKNK